MDHRTTLRIDNRSVITLADIIPSEGAAKMLIVAKTPAHASVEAGHYFQGRQPRMFWNRLREYDLLTVPPATHEDDVLLAHGYGITDIVKAPRNYGNEPSDDEYRAGLDRILALISQLQPRVVMFVYKRVLDQVLRLSFGHGQKSSYGFNPDLEELFGSRVFAFPMPGTPCTSAQAIIAMNELADTLGTET